MTDKPDANERLDRPIFRVKRDRKGWGVQVKWPRPGTGPWAKAQFRPRWVWHGPFGDGTQRWADGNDALRFANFCQENIDKIALKETPDD